MKTKSEMKTEEIGVEGLDRPLNDGFPKDSRSDKILIIDDSSAIRDMIQLVLSQNNYETFAVGNEEEGLEVLESEKIGLIILNLRSGKGGWRVLNRLEEQGSTKQVPIIMVSGEELSLEKISQSETERLTWYLEKPLLKDELVEISDKLMNWQGKIQEVEEWIKNSLNGEGDFAEGYRELSRREIIHACFLKKLREIKEESSSVQEKSKVEQLLEHERDLIGLLGSRVKRILDSVEQGVPIESYQEKKGSKPTIYT